ncbi:MAG: hypothetical protein HQL07_03875 [Nitrospirae bacterium]|nr:hypothetical protein [Magnetococcales bacterium]HAT48859.1 hypothetical protein [Alphaproteobacteria bacterium]
MRRTKTLDLDGIAITVHELTVAEVRNWEADLSDKERKFDLVSESLMDNVSLSDIVRMSNATMPMLDSMTPSMVDEIIAVAKELNPHFFTMRGRLMDAARLLPPTL